MTVIAPTTAGSRVSGGAGAQINLKTFHTLGVYGYMALTCIISMDSKDGWNHRFVPVGPDAIADQIEICAAVHSCIDAVKIGMLGIASIIDVAEQALRTYDFPTVVLDPVLIYRGQEFGGALEVGNALRTKILSRATMTTPNLFEAAMLAGMEETTTVGQLKDAVKHIHNQGVPNALAKVSPSLGTGTALDVFYDGTILEALEAEVVGTERVHDTGCTLAAVVTAELVRGASPLEAAVAAKEVVSSFIRHGLCGNMPFLYVYQGEYQQG